MTTNCDIDDKIDCSFDDIDVVGFSDFPDFRSDGVLFDFETNNEFRLFGEADTTFSRNGSSYSSGNEKEHLGNSLSPTSNKNLKNIQKIRNKFSRNWNEMEKDLFLKGLEMFGKKWEKISKFIATKTAYQVKRYYQEWSKTGNVIPDSVNLANDSSIYLPSSGDTDEFSTDTDINCSPDTLRKEQDNSNLGLGCDNTSLSSSSCSEVQPFGIEMPMGKDIVVSSLNDWNIGSQVSVIGSEEELGDESQEHFDRKFSLTKLNNVSTKLITKSDALKIKRLNNAESIKTGKGILRPSKEDYSSFNRICRTKSIPMLEGQIIRINKNQNEDSDVNISDSDDEVDGRKKRVKESCMDVKSNFACETSEFGEIKFYSKMLDELTVDERTAFQNLSSHELRFCSSLSLVCYGTDIKKYITARNFIIDEWNKVKPLRLEIENMIIPDIDFRFYYELYTYLKSNKIINDFSTNLSNNSSNNQKKQNAVSKKTSSRKKTYLPKRVLGSGNLHAKVVKKGGGITFSHDSSGAVVDAVHIPESSSTAKIKNGDSKPQANEQNIKLVNCNHYDSKNPAPFKVLLHPLTLLSLDFHSHSSFSEVIGLLGGFLDEIEGVLHVTQAVPTRASSSDFECEMCPVSQKEAFVAIQEKGIEVVGWYHSHPSFSPNPSQKDLDTQSQYQKWFSKNGSPFIGLIISSYCPSPNISRASLIRTFILDSSPKHTFRKKELCKDSFPYELRWKIRNESDMEWDEIELLLKNILQQRKHQNDLVRWREEWIDGVTYLQKYIFSLSAILPSYNEEVINLVFDYLTETL